MDIYKDRQLEDISVRTVYKNGKQILWMESWKFKQYGQIDGKKDSINRLQIYGKIDSIDRELKRYKLGWLKISLLNYNVIKFQIIFLHKYIDIYNGNSTAGQKIQIVGRLLHSHTLYQ